MVVGSSCPCSEIGSKLIFRNYRKEELPDLNILYIDRVLSNRLLSTCKELRVGPNVNDVRVNVEATETIISYATTPPTIPDFTNQQFMTVSVKVPYESLEAYKNAEVWKNFWNMEGFDVANVETLLSATPKTVTYTYDFSGRPITSDYKGFAIVRYSDGSTEKKLIK